MTKSHRRCAVLFAFAVGLSAAACTKSYVVWEHAQRSQLLWGHDEAYLFIGVGRSGWSGDSAASGWQAVRNAIGLSTRSAHKRNAMIIVHITTQGITQRRLEDAIASSYYPFENRIYGVHNGTLSKWTGEVFVPISKEEERRFEARQAAYGPYDNVAGWSNRVNLLGRPPGVYQFPLTIGDVQIVITATVEGESPRRRRLDIRVPGKPIVTILDISDGPRHVSLAEYQKMFP